MQTPEIMRAAPSIIAWEEAHELRYVLEDDGAAQVGALSSASSTTGSRHNSASCRCFYCGTRDAGDASLSTRKTDAEHGTRLFKCSQCLVAQYCRKECQLLDWKARPNGHKHTCAMYKRVGFSMNISSKKDQEEARNQMFSRIRFYACSYTVHKAKTMGLGRGFLLIQSSGTLAMMSLIEAKVDAFGCPLPMRSVMLHYLTLGEYDRDLCRDDFEMTVVRSELIKALESYDDERQLVLLMKFRCGHLVVGVAPLIPDFGICRKLGMDYYADHSTDASLQLNLDEL